MHDLLAWGNKPEFLYLPLWLLEYDVPFGPVRELFLRNIDLHLQELTQGETDPVRVFDHIVDLIEEKRMPAWKYSPRPNKVVKQFGGPQVYGNGCGKDFCTSRTGSFTPIGSAAAEQAFVAHGRPVGDNDQSNTVWVGVPATAPGAFHTGTRLRSPQMIFERNISPDSVPYAVCAD